jgi:hypothetical protein
MVYVSPGLPTCDCGATTASVATLAQPILVQYEAPGLSLYESVTFTLYPSVYVSGSISWSYSTYSSSSWTTIPGNTLTISNCPNFQTDQILLLFSVAPTLTTAYTTSSGSLVYTTLGVTRTPVPTTITRIKLSSSVPSQDISIELGPGQFQEFEIETPTVINASYWGYVVDVLTAGRRFNPYSYSASSLNVYSGPYTCSPSTPACTTPGSICNSLLLPTNVESSCDSNYVDDPNCNCRMLIRECSTSVGQYGNRFWVNGASGDPTYHIARGQIRVSIKYFWPQPTPTPCITVPPTVPSAKVTPILNPYIWQGSLLYVYQSALNFSLSGLSQYYSVQLSQNLYQNTLYSYSVYIMSETTMRDSIYTCIETPQATCTGNAPCNAVWQWNNVATIPNTNLFGSTTNNIYPSTQVSFFSLTPGLVVLF